MNNDASDPVTATAPVATATDHGPVDDHRQGADVACHHATVTTVPLSPAMPSADDDADGFLSDALFACAPPASLQKPSASTMCHCNGQADNSDIDTGRRRRRRYRDDDNSNLNGTWCQLASMAMLALAVSVLVVTVMRPSAASGVDGTLSNVTGPTIVDNATTTILAPCHCAGEPRPGPTVEGRLTISGSVATCTCTWPVERVTTTVYMTVPRWVHDFFSNLDALAEPVRTALVIVALTVAAPLFFLHLFFGA
ncbi:hypothetical protein TW95_gp0448 [Pandoravirus inopinatum]|uniref:Uncharacterized protein n=1 Tax=Pandoravirus inopinatum TaxID=1605721 RepID=A0A0B5JC81_9VIRU|nr:hypothetical protein TW95_gp0448 [Pandoravirus inopinatum]AJF97182.1 hypothetical protein [Pandoravirus inopinatum]